MCRIPYLLEVEQLKEAAAGQNMATLSFQDVEEMFRSSARSYFLAVRGCNRIGIPFLNNKLVVALGVTMGLAKDAFVLVWREQLGVPYDYPVHNTMELDEIQRIKDEEEAGVGI